MVLFIGPLYSGKHEAAKAYAEAAGKQLEDLKVCEDAAALTDASDAAQYDIILYTEVGSGLVVGWYRVGVHVERDRCAGMPEPGLHRLDVNAIAERERRLCVPQLVHVQLGEPEHVAEHFDVLALAVVAQSPSAQMVGV